MEISTGLQNKSKQIR